MSDKLQYLFLLPPKFRKGISQIKKHLVLLFTLYSFGLFWCYPDPNQCFLKWIRIGKRNRSGSGSGAGIEVDPDPTKCSGSGSETLHYKYIFRSVP